MFFDKHKIIAIMDMLDSLDKEERDALIEKYYVDYKNLSPIVKKMKDAFDNLTDEEKDEFMKAINYKKPSERMVEEMKKNITCNEDICAEGNSKE